MSDSTFASRPIGSTPPSEQDALVTPTQAEVAARTARRNAAPKTAQAKKSAAEDKPSPIVIDVDLNTIEKKEYSQFGFRLGTYAFGIRAKNDEVVWDTMRMLDGAALDYHEMFDGFFPKVFECCYDADGNVVEDGLNVLFSLLPGYERDRDEEVTDDGTATQVWDVVKKIIVAACDKWSSESIFDENQNRRSRRANDKRPRSRR